MIRPIPCRLRPVPGQELLGVPDLAKRVALLNSLSAHLYKSPQKGLEQHIKAGPGSLNGPEICKVLAVHV